MLQQDGDSTPNTVQEVYVLGDNQDGFLVRGFVPPDGAAGSYQRWDWCVDIPSQNFAAGYVDGRVYWSISDAGDLQSHRSNVYAIIEDLNQPVYTVY